MINSFAIYETRTVSAKRAEEKAVSRVIATTVALLRAHPTVRRATHAGKLYGMREKSIHVGMHKKAKRAQTRGHYQKIDRRMEDIGRARRERTVKRAILT